MRRLVLALAVAGLSLCHAGRVSAQGFGAASSKPRPWSRVSFYTNTARTSIDGGDTRVLSELSTAFTYQLPDVDEGGADYGLDVRYAAYSQDGHPARTSIYEGFVGVRMMDGQLRARGGHLWVSDVGGLGSVAGGSVEYRQRRTDPDAGRFRAGAFGGLEPNIFDTGYAPDVTKFGGFVTYDGAAAQRHSIGYVLIRNGPLTERSVLTMANFLPVRRKLFVYQAAEVNLQPPAGMGHGGLAYFFANVRVTPTEKLEFQGTYNRGRAVDARGLGGDVINGRPVTQSAIDGLLYESAGGRATVEVLPRVRVYAGYSRDKNNRDTDPTDRVLIGGYASNVGGTGFDLTASDSIMNRTTGSYDSFYISVGRQIGRRTYVSGDFSSSLSVIRFSRSDGIVIETRPHATRVSGTVTASINRAWSLMGTLEDTNETDLGELRVLAGLTYRIK